MKKLFLIITISLLLVIMPISSANTINKINIEKENHKLITKEQINIELATPTEDEPPKWANGNFTGLWGFDIFGQTHIPLGWMFGYYKRSPKFGYFYAAFESFWGENDTWYIQGWFFGPFMFGSLGENEYANQSVFAGLGGYNETHYHWRLMGEEGPTCFMHGEYTKFE